MIIIIDRGAERGLFNGSEMAGVGSIRNRLTEITQAMEEAASDEDEDERPE
jgi:hypothetical protein